MFRVFPLGDGACGLRLLLCTVLATAMMSFSSPAIASDDDLLFYNPEINEGSELAFNPLSAWVNGGFDILRQPSYGSRLPKLRFDKAFSNMWRNLRAPVWAIESTGTWGEFVDHEIFPWKRLFGRESKSFLPNYTLHTLGEGMLSRKLGEWYKHHDYSYPYLLGILTTFSLQLVNEGLENANFDGPNWDPVADMYLFNPLGWALFQIPSVARFFSGPVKVLHWPHQPVFDLRNGELFNVGENFILKVALGANSRFRYFQFMGTGGLFGLSASLGKVGNVSLGLGAGIVELVPKFVASGARIMTNRGRLNRIVGVFWDRNDSLLASAFLGGAKNPRLQVNVFPGCVRVFGVAVGGYLLLSKFEGSGAGITFQYAPVVPGLLFAKDRSLEHF